MNRENYVFSIFDQEGVMYRSSNGYELLDDTIASNVNYSLNKKNNIAGENRFLTYRPR